MDRGESGPAPEGAMKPPTVCKTELERDEMEGEARSEKH
jgi:hypothetical protein